MKELLLAAMMIASRLSDLPMAEELPTVAFLPPEHICAAVEACDTGQVVRGYYDMQKRLLVLPTDWSPSEPRDLGALVHEMVHHLQREKWPDPGSRPCRGGIEKTAYDAQEVFLRSLGLELQLGLLFRMIVTHCDD